MKDTNPNSPAHHTTMRELEAIATRLGDGELTESEAFAASDAVMSRLAQQSVAHIDTKRRSAARARRLASGIVVAGVIIAACAFMALR